MRSTPSIRLILSWALVTVLLGYGIIQTAITAAKLFK
ncbi:MFS transporter small subunit [Winogradskya humida]